MYITRVHTHMYLYYLATYVRTCSIRVYNCKRCVWHASLFDARDRLNLVHTVSNNTIISIIDHMHACNNVVVGEALLHCTANLMRCMVTMHNKNAARDWRST